MSQEPTRQRFMRVENVDENGVFAMTLATEGEASDGDILSIEGGVIPDRMPLLLSHWNDPTARAGSITEPEKHLKSKPPALRTKGQIELGGEGNLAEIRRDVAYMINRHGGSVSIRWDEVDGTPPIRRVNLPSDHPYYVNADEEKGRKRWGYFWPAWRALEGSIVALGADPAATIDARVARQRAEETEGEVAAFWRSMAETVESTTIPPSDTVTTTGGTSTTTGIDLDLELEPREEPSEEAKQAAALAAVREAAEQALANAIEPKEIAEALRIELSIPDELLERIEALSNRIDDLEEAREEGQETDDSPPPKEREEPGAPLAPEIMRPAELVALLRSELEAAGSRVIGKFRADLKKARGSVSNE